MVNMMNLWDPRKTDDYKFIDNEIEDYFNLGGVGMNFYKYVGIHDQGENNDSTQPSKAKSKKKGIKQIQDLFYQENRDRNYDTNPYEIKAIYNMNDVEFDIRQFGMFIEADTIYIYVHMNSVWKKIGRKPIPGDVLEMVHMREDISLEEEDFAINKYYAIQEVSRAASGWDPSYRPHIWRIKIKPMADSQEYNDILSMEDEKSDLNIRDLISNFNAKMEVSEESRKQAEYNVPYRNFDSWHIYVMDSANTGKDYPWIWAGDGIPPNGAKLAGKGSSFPSDSKDGDWWLLTSVNPPKLFKHEGSSWSDKGVDLRMKWESAHRILHSFINNETITHMDDGCFKEKQPVFKAMTPRGKN